jgi:nucleotide-binding universal stress UspA family protein
MAFEVILAVLGGIEGDETVLNAARSVEKQFHSQIDCLHVVEDPHSLPYLDAGISPGTVASLLAAVDAQIDARRAKAKTAFARLRTADLKKEPAWIERKGSEREISRQGRFADLIVLGRPGAAAENLTTTFFSTALDAALFGTPRPALIVPPVLDGPLPFRDRPVAVAWNGSLEADRAVGAALPILRAASRVVVVIGEESRAAGENSADGLKTYLGRHGIDVTIVTSKVDAASAGPYILEQAREIGAGLLVMGAYTHSRLREFVLGGVTKHVCEHAPLPVLMAH